MWSEKYNKCIVCGTIEGKHGGKGMCKKCYILEWRKNNYEKVKDYKDKWNNANPEKVKEIARKKEKRWRIEHPEEQRIRTKKWREENPERMKVLAKEWRKKNIIKVKYWGQRYYKKNKDKINKHRREYSINKYKNDSIFRLKSGASKSIGLRLRQCLSSKQGGSTWGCLPYTPEELMLHLEKQFLPGMTRENYGLWELDHKKPHSLYHYTSMSLDDKDFQECWALKNLQPLWKEDNLKKGNKYINN